jgi:peptide/nickel transport system ATP-binding protein
MSEEKMVEIQNLYVNFYTQSGVVKAIDGVNLTLYRGETFGLVGETGCGKSVTANCIMKLIPQPPGKIERGRIYFLPPSGTGEEIKKLEDQIAELSSRNDQPKDDKKVANLQKELAEQKAVADIIARWKLLWSQPPSTERDAKLSDLDKELYAILGKYDLIPRTKKYMQKIRGKYISMIFQEPMSALNPVFTAGYQISEVLLLHERKELALSALKSVEEERKYLKTHKLAKKIKDVKGENKCSICSSAVQDEMERCPNCDNYFKAVPLKPLKVMSLGLTASKLKKVAKNPYTFLNRHRAGRRIKLESMERAERMLRLVRIPDPQKVVNSYPHELSGGMQQRVMIAMALACKPNLLIADEPTTALDVTIQAQILKLMRELQEETGTSILMITHNLGVVAEMCDRVGVMYAGVMAEVGPMGPVFKEPLHPYTQGLMNSIPKVNIDMPRLETIEGNVPNLIKPPNGCRFHPRCPYAMDICRKEKPPMMEIRPNHLAACHLYTGVNL